MRAIRARILAPGWFEPNVLLDREVTEAIVQGTGRVYERKLDNGKMQQLVVIDGGKIK